MSQYTQLSLFEQFPVRRCNNCKCEFPLVPEYWHKNKSSPDGFAYRCKDCARAIAKKWGRDNPERNQARAKIWAVQNPERVSENKRRYYSDNKPRLQTYNQAHADHIRELKRSPAYKAKAVEYRKRKADKRREYLRQYRANHPGHYNKLTREWRKANPEAAKAIMQKRIAARHAAEGTFDANDVKRMYIEQDGRCAYCGIPIYFDLPRDIHVDHVLPLVRYKNNKPDNLHLACSSCNQSKGQKTIAEWYEMRGW